MTSNRDDFTEPTKVRLAKRVNYHCSNPGCRQPTVGPTANPEGVTNVGMAAHITAASPGFARYDTAMTPAQRKNISNGIWCCQVHGKMIDDDEATYPVALLQQWKADAEAEAKRAIESPRSKSSNTLNKHRLKADQKILREIVVLLPSNGVTMDTLQTHNFDWIFEFAWFDDLQEFVRRNGPEHEFLDAELEQHRSKLIKSASTFLKNVALETCHARTNGWREIPEEWGDTQPERFKRVLKLLNDGATQICEDYDALVRSGRQKLGV